MVVVMVVVMVMVMGRIAVHSITSLNTEDQLAVGPASTSAPSPIRNQRKWMDTLEMGQIGIVTHI